MRKIKMHIQDLVTDIAALESLAKQFPQQPSNRLDSKRLSALYLKDLNPGYTTTNWIITVGIAPPAFDNFIKTNNPSLHSRLKATRTPNTITDGAYSIDFPHLMAVVCGYDASNCPSFWTGWGGDLATGMKDVTNYMNNNPGKTAQQAANYVIENNFFSCGMEDLRGDADAIGIVKYMKQGKSLSQSVDEYYKYNGGHRYRFDHIKQDIGGTDAKLEINIKSKMTGLLEQFPNYGLINLAGNPSDAVITASCNAFAYLLRNANFS